MTDPIVKTATWLAGHVEWMRHRAEADEFLTAVEACMRLVRGLARGPAAQRYLGPCGARIETLSDETSVLVSRECDGDIYARVGALSGSCRTCGATASALERQAWLDGTVRTHAFRASEIAQAYRVNVNTIRSWAGRGLLVAHGHDGEGRPLFNVGEVLDLAAADAARRATEQAKRARRAAAKAAETEDAA
jgi:hypothetical protein